MRGRELRANRSGKSRRECARCARDRIRPVAGGEVATGGDKIMRDALVSHELDAGAPMNSAAPIVPEQWSRTNLERMQQHAHADVGFAVVRPFH